MRADVSELCLAGKQRLQVCLAVQVCRHDETLAETVGGRDEDQVGWELLVSPHLDRVINSHWSRSNQMLRSHWLSYAIRTQLKAPKVSYQKHFLHFAVSLWIYRFFLCMSTYHSECLDLNL